jgi:rhodanese-related sulfurtransferase
MKNPIFILTAMASILLVSCNSKTASQNFISDKESISVRQASEMMKGNALMIDVRSAAEIEELAYDVKNLKNIPLDSLETRLSEIPKDKQVILVCRTDNRSGKAFELLKTKGFENMAVMKGGIQVWQDAGFPVKEGKRQERKACCANPNSKDCNPDGTCKPKSADCKSADKACCSGGDAAKCSTEQKQNCSKENAAKCKEGEKACCAKPDEKVSEAAPASNTSAKQNRLEVYCFHGTRQCETCINMKANTKATLNKYFAEQLKNGSIVFSIIDVDDAENEKLAAKFQATGTALMINNVVNGKDHITDWSDFAFDKANDANKFMPELKSKIEAVLKK